MAVGNAICVPITEGRAEPFLAAIHQASKMADAIELRLDYLDENELDGVLNRLPEQLSTVGKPAILTFRPREEGGRRDLDICDRLEFWRNLSPGLLDLATFVDLELDLVEALDPSQSPIPWKKVICSYHNFETTPTDLTDIADGIALTPAAIVKVATLARTIDDSLRLMEVLDRKPGGKPTIALGMGIPGIMTRVLALSRGALLTFGSLRPGAGSASGQPTVRELLESYRVKSISRQTEVLAVIGNPIGHSRSPAIHNAALAATGRDAVFLPLEVSNHISFVRDFVRPATNQIGWQMRGFSVTIPLKVAIIDQLDVIDPLATRVGAVNTVVVEDGSLHGYNTDVAGAMKPLQELIELRDARVAVIGNGGSARAVCAGLTEAGAVVTVYGRDPRKSEMLASQFGIESGELSRFRGLADILINCTPIGMRGHSEGSSPIAADVLGNVGLVYDLIYNPEETALLKQAREAGSRTLGGLAMLVAQAAEQFRLFTGEEAPVAVMARAARSTDDEENGEGNSQ
jgi:3-dehydroquinate dehydratase/shikimate dehydrogenase